MKKLPRTYLILIFFLFGFINLEAQSWQNCNAINLTLDDLNSDLDFSGQPSDCGCPGSNGGCTLVKIKMVETINGVVTPKHISRLWFMPPLTPPFEPNHINRDFIDIFSPYTYNCSEIQAGANAHSYQFSPVAPAGHEMHVLVCPGSESGIMRGRFALPTESTLSAPSMINATDGDTFVDVSFKSTVGLYYMAFRNADACNETWVPIDANTNWPQATTTSMTIRHQIGGTPGQQYEYRVVASNESFNPQFGSDGVWSFGDLGHSGALVTPFDITNSCDQDCLGDTEAPVLISSDAVQFVDAIPNTNFYVFNPLDFFTDNCSETLNYWGIVNSICDIGPGWCDTFFCGETYDLEIECADENQNTVPANFQVQVNCQTNSCPNTAMHFDGSDDRILFEDLTFSSDFTVGGWFKAEDNISGTNEDRLISFGSTNRLDIGIENDGTFWRYDPNAIGPNQKTYNQVRNGKWHHFIFVAEGSVRVIYLDFVEIDRYDATSPSYGPKFAVGGWAGSNGGGTLYHGELDEIRFFTQSISESNHTIAFGNNPMSYINQLAIYLDFEEGQPNQDNSPITVANNRGQLQHGLLENFTLNGEISNYICSDLPQYNFDGFDCTEECTSSSVDLSTGINFNDGSHLPAGQYDGGWQMISGPDQNILYPQPGFVINPWPSWQTLDGAEYISPFANAAFNGLSLTPYLFERCFCVCEDTASVTLDLKAYVDNFLTVDLYDENGMLIQELIDHNSFLGNPATSVTNHTLLRGQYCLRAGLRNDGSTAMGMSIEAKVTGAGLIENGCCNPFTAISGYALIDNECNSESNVDLPLINTTIVLNDLNGNEIASATTDAFGFYIFHDITIGNYIVTQQSAPGYTITTGNSGFPVEVIQNQVNGSINFLNCPNFNCTPKCISNSVDLSTGVNFNDGSLLPSGRYDGGWQMISGPDQNINYPRPGYVINAWPSWQEFNNATYISPFANARFNGQSSIPYLFERCFCVCEETSVVTIDLKAYVDNFLKIELYDENGNIIAELLDHDSFLGAPGTSNTTHTLTRGQYCLRAGLRNDGSTAMGMSIEASISGAGMIENGCCDPFTAISGSSLILGDCNSDANIDEPLIGANISLCTLEGEQIATTTTDAFGFYIFHDVEPGNYLIKQEEAAGYNLIEGALGLQVFVEQNQAIGDLDFGNCPDVMDLCCATDEELSIRAHQAFHPATITMPNFPDQCVLGFELDENLYDCQFVGMIMWGDGTLSDNLAGQPIPTHTYTNGGVYIVSIFVYSQNNAGQICQTDIIDIPFVYAPECIVSNFDLQNTNRFTLSPNPSLDILHIELESNRSGQNGEITNELGELIKSFTIDTEVQVYSLSTSGLPAGVYTITLINDSGQRLVSRFIKI